jgi:hypothetical protein
MVNSGTCTINSASIIGNSTGIITLNSATTAAINSASILFTSPVLRGNSAAPSGFVL